MSPLENAYVQLAEARLKAYEACAEDLSKALAFITGLQRIVTEKDAALSARDTFIAEQGQFIRFLSMHVPQDLEYPAPFAAMVQAGRAQ
jgi:hypothetical protein